MKITRKQLEIARHQGCGVYGYKKAFCDLHDCCEECDKKVRFICKLIAKMEKLQDKRILKICRPEEGD